MEETADTIYLVLPGTPMVGREGGELSDRELESVAGAGADFVTYPNESTGAFYQDGP